MTYYILRPSYLCETPHDVYYQWSIGNNIFVSAMYNKVKVAYIRPSNPTLDGSHLMALDNEMLLV